MSKIDLKRDSEKRLKNKGGRKHKRDTKLQELEKQLEFAESRCGTLKQQLDYIKLLYGCKKFDENEKQPSKEEGCGDGCDVNQYGYSDISKWEAQAGTFGGREDGDCPDFAKQTISHTNTTSTNSSNKQNSLILNQEKGDGELKKRGYLKHKGHFKLLKVKKKTSKKVKKRRKLEDPISKISNASSQTHSQIWHDAVVEIYKNAAVNVESESGFEIIGKKNGKLFKSSEGSVEVKKPKFSKNPEIVDSEDKKEKILVEPKAKSCNSLNVKKKALLLKEEGVQTELLVEIHPQFQNKKNEITDSLNKENLIKTENNLYEQVKSYCQPTISSKKKQVDRDIYSNLTNINVRNIPFIAAKSTAPSHNIGVNIQQVLSIIKKRQPLNENLANSTPETPNLDNPLIALLASKKTNTKTEVEQNSEVGATITGSAESKKRPDGVRTSLSHWKSNAEFVKEKLPNVNEKSEEDQSHDWSLKVDKLKKVLVFLHEDFTSLSQKYKRLQKKLTKRNITKTDAKDELADIERDLEKKEEEITVVIGLYKEVLSLREDLKKSQEKYNLVTCGKSFMFEGLKQSSSTHTQMTTLLRKIQNFQDQLKG